MRSAALPSGMAAALFLYLAPVLATEAADPSDTCGAGKLAVNAGRYEESLRLYQDCLSADSLAREVQLDAHFNAGRALRELGRYAEAAEHFAQTVRLVPDYAPATAALAEALESAGEYEDGLAALDAFDALVPRAQNGYLLEQRGRVNVLLGRYEDAIAAFNTAAGLSDKSYRLLVNRGFAFAALERFDEAFADFEAAIAMEPNEPQAYGYYGHNLLLNNRYDEAAAVLNKVLEIDPASVSALIERGDVKLYLGDLEGALADFTLATEIDPKNVKALGNRALAKSYLGDFEGTLVDAEATLALAPRDTLALYLRAEQLNLRNRPNDARRDLELVLAAEPENADAHHELSTSLFLLGEWDASLAELDRAIEIQPMVGRHYVARGYLRLRLGGGAATLLDFDRALADQSADYSWYFSRAYAFAWLNRSDDARRDIDAAFALMSEEEKAWHSNEICWELLLQGRTTLAAPLCEQATELAGDAPSLDSRAFLYWQTGQPDKAEADLAQAQSVARNPKFFEPTQRLGQFPTTLVQGLLTFLGYRPDPPDRGTTERTQQAIMAFQRDHGLAADGNVSPELIEALKAARP